MLWRSIQEPVRVLLHVNGGYTKVLFERTEGLGIADGGIIWEIPTHVIPFHLRPLGSRFLLMSETLTAELKDTGEELRDAVRQMLASVRIVELEKP